MKMFEVTILSDHCKLLDFAPKFYRSNKFIFINSLNIQVPEKWCGNYCRNLRSNWAINSYRIEIVDEVLYIRCKTKTLELNINPKDFAVRVMLPIESDFSSFELISVQYLKEDAIKEPTKPPQDVLSDLERNDELKDFKEFIEPVLSDLEQPKIEPKTDKAIPNVLSIQEPKDKIELFVPKSLEEDKKK